MHSDEADGAKPTSDSALLHTVLQRRFCRSWYAFLPAGEEGAPDALGRTPEEAAERLCVELRRTHTDVLEPDDSRDLPTFLAERGADYAAGGLVEFHAPDEMAAWTGWRLLSGLSVREAFRTWRTVFAPPVLGEDLVAADANTRARREDLAAGRAHAVDLARPGVR